MESLKDKIVILGSDHNGIELKKEVKSYLTDEGYHCIDIGSYGTYEGSFDYTNLSVGAYYLKIYVGEELIYTKYINITTYVKPSFKSYSNMFHII